MFSKSLATISISGKQAFALYGFVYRYCSLSPFFSRRRRNSFLRVKARRAIPTVAKLYAYPRFLSSDRTSVADFGSLKNPSGASSIILAGNKPCDPLCVVPFVLSGSISVGVFSIGTERDLES